MAGERRGGFRVNPTQYVPSPLEEGSRRTNASFVRGVLVPKDGLYANVTGEDGFWRYIGESGEPSFQNSWVNYSVTWDYAAFFKDALGIVHFKGLIKNGTIGQTVFTLPVGYRPRRGIHTGTASNGAYGQIQITSSGNVVAQVGSSSWFSLSFSFPAEQ